MQIYTCSTCTIKLLCHRVIITFSRNWAAMSVQNDSATPGFLSPLQVSTHARTSHDIATVIWCTFWVIFSHHFSRPPHRSRPPQHRLSLLASFTRVLRFAWRRHCIRSVFNAIDYLHHRGIADRDLKYTWSLTYLTNPRTFSTSSTTPTWHRHCWLWHASPFPTLCSKRETSPFSRRTTHPISGSFGYVVPEVIKNTGRRVLAHQYDCFPTHTQMKHKLIILSPHSHNHLHSPLRLSLFLCQYHHYHCPVKRQLQNFRVHTGTRFRSSQVLHQMSPLPQLTPSSRFPGGLMRSLACPYHHRRHAIPQSWSWSIIVTGCWGRFDNELTYVHDG